MAESAVMTDSIIQQIDLLVPSESTIAYACEILQNGGLVVAPTETRYGLLARVDQSEAVEKLFDVKGRDTSKPSAIFVNNISELSKLAEVVPIADKLARTFLPGPLTLVLKAKREFGTQFTQNGLTGFRISSSKVISSISEKSGLLLSATSANISGEPETETIEKIHEQFGDKIDLYLDSGRLNNPVSTVVQVVDREFRILRAGAISESEIQKALI